jgi:hypothetical protein
MARKKTDLELNFINRLRKSVNPKNFDWLPPLIVSTIKRGISPVQGGGRFKRYSDSYRDAISKASGEAKKKEGQLSPVNMTLTGEMNNSLEAKKSSKSGAVTIQFDDPKAYFHNNSGAGNSRAIRRLLPDRKGERFSRNIQEKILETFKELARKAAGK